MVEVDKDMKQYKMLVKELQLFYSRMSKQDISLEPIRPSELEIPPRLKQVALFVGQFKQLIQKPTRDPNYLAEIKDKMMMIQSQLMICKTVAQEEHEQFEIEINGLEHDLKLLEDGLERAALPSREQSYKTGASNGLLSQVVQFLKFVAKYGHEGGWDPINHIAFVNLKKKYQGDFLYRYCAQRLVGVSYQDAVEHDEWHREYEKKLQEKKQAILNWKHQKVVTAKEMDFQEIPEQIMEKKSVDVIKEKERELKKFQLSLWKKELQRQKLEKEREEKELEATMLERRKTARKWKPRLTKSAPVIMNREKEDAPVVRIPEMSIKDRKLILQRQRQRETEFLEKKNRLKKEEQENRLKREARLEKLKCSVRVEVQRDPERLLLPTKGLLEKYRSTTPDLQPNWSFPIANQKRAIPTWRIGCT